MPENESIANMIRLNRLLIRVLFCYRIACNSQNNKVFKLYERLSTVKQQKCKIETILGCQQRDHQLE